MSRYPLLLCVLLLLILSAPHAWALEAVDSVITTAIVDREPVDKVQAFPVASGKLYCFTRVVGAEEPTVVYHVWFRGDRLMSRVELAVNSNNWRTWSAKKFTGDQSGAWRVEIQDAAGNVMQQVDFLLR
mgnify:CR=1 FL=1